MKIVTTKKELATALSAHSEATIGLVPTMGALHKGHASLVERCRSDNGVTVVSVFVNPTQFNDPNDLEKYPRTLPEDARLLESLGCDILFAPSIAEMYPESDLRTFDFAPLDTVMEGVCRPGHFNGVAQIVSKLFDAVQPTRAYFGEKDFQQLAVIRRMVQMLQFSVELVACPVVREADGLAMSSRNVHLTPQQRAIAPMIFQTLSESCTKIKTMPLQQLRQWVTDSINHAGMEVEYFEIVDKNSLQPVNTYAANILRGCIAVKVGEVRLIDNIAY